jgi:hypothetical protein
VQKQQTSRRKSHHGSDNPLPTTTTTELRICIRQKRFSLQESGRAKKIKKQEAAARTKERKSRCELQKRSQQQARARHFVFFSSKQQQAKGMEVGRKTKKTKKNKIRKKKS